MIWALGPDAYTKGWKVGDLFGCRIAATHLKSRVTPAPNYGTTSLTRTSTMGRNQFRQKTFRAQQRLGGQGCLKRPRELTGLNQQVEIIYRQESIKFQAMYNQNEGRSNLHCDSYSGCILLHNKTSNNFLNNTVIFPIAPIVIHFRFAR